MQYTPSLLITLPGEQTIPKEPLVSKGALPATEAQVVRKAFFEAVTTHGPVTEKIS